MTELFQTLRFSIRSLRRSPALSAVSILALSLGIGLTTAMYSIVRGGLADLPMEDADRLMHLERNQPSEGIDSMEVTVHDFLDWREQQASFEDLAGFYTGTANLAGEEARPERYEAAFMSANSFEVLGSEARLGRTFQPGEDSPAVAPVVVLGHDAWRDRFRGDPDIVGRVVRINGEATTVVGVMPEGFRFPILQDLWLPLRIDTATLERGEGITLEVYGRLRPEATLESARTEMQGIAERLALAYPDTNEGVGAVVKPYTLEFIGEEAVALLYTMLVAVFGVLLIACANVANLLLARTALRSREVAVRTTLGAGRFRVVAGVLAEALILAAAGAALGLGLAAAGVALFDRAIAATQPPYWLEFGIDLRVGAFVVAAALLATLLSGLLPALQASGARAGEVLKDESRGASSFRLGRLARGLVVAEIALACGLLVATGLMVKSVVQLRAADYGFQTEGIFTSRIGLFETDYPTPEERVRFFEALQARLEERPEVRSVGLTTSLPILGSDWSRVALPGEAYERDQDLPWARTVTVSPGFFETFGVEALEGRLLGRFDRRDTQAVALVNRPFAELHFPGESPVGRQVRLGGLDTEEPWRTIVGVVPDMVLGGQDNEDPEAVYLPLAQGDVRFVSVAATSAGDPMALAPVVREAVGALDSDLPIYFVQTMEEAVRLEMWFVDVFGAIFAVFGLAGLVLAVVGLYGVMAFSVQRRTQEVGIRMALGADGRRILELLVRQGAVQLALGTAVGVGLALALAQGIRVLLYRVEPWDLSIFAAIVAVILVTGFIATLLPARRAMAVHPAAALRS
jgi:predicted permease